MSFPAGGNFFTSRIRGSRVSVGVEPDTRGYKLLPPAATGGHGLTHLFLDWPRRHVDWASGYKRTAADVTLFDLATMADEDLIWLPHPAGSGWPVFAAREGKDAVHTTNTL